MKKYYWLLPALLGLGCASDPPHKTVERAYFKCDASKSLEGGIYGKGPFLRFGPHPASCSRSQWIRISHSDFTRLATEWHSKDWSVEIPFWNDAGEK